MPVPKRKRFLIRQRQKRRKKSKKTDLKEKLLVQRFIPLGIARFEFFEKSQALVEVCNQVKLFQKQGIALSAKNRKKIINIFSDYLAIGDSANAIIQKLEPELGTKRIKELRHELKTQFETPLIGIKGDPILNEFLSEALAGKNPEKA